MTITCKYLLPVDVFEIEMFNEKMIGGHYVGLVQEHFFSDMMFHVPRQNAISLMRQQMQLPMRWTKRRLNCSFYTAVDSLLTP